MSKFFIINVITLIVILLPGSIPGSAVSSTKKSMPDFCQADTRLGGLPENGAAYCGPVAVSNALMWLGQNGFPNLLSRSAEPGIQVKLIKTLAGPNYMETSLTTGTPPKRLMSGLEKFISDSGHSISIQYMGWRSSKNRVGKVPILNQLLQKIDEENVILDIGWYKLDRNSRTFQRIGGHYITIVGHNHSNGTDYLYIHDPAKRSGMDKRTERCKIVNLPEDHIFRNQSGETFSSNGYFSIQGIIMKEGADLAIVDGVISFSIYD